MLRHNFLITWRGFMRNKTAFFINLTGLSMGLAAALLIYLWVTDEMRMDSFHEQDSRLYQVMHNFEIPQSILTVEITPVPMAEALVEEIPEVEHAVMVNDFFNWRNREGILMVGGRRIAAEGRIAGEDFFNVFTYPLLQGVEDQVLRDKQAIVISERLARKLFQTTENIVGQTVEWEYTGFDGVFRVSGIFADPPVQSTEQFDFVMHIDQLKDNDRWADRWTGNTGKTFVVLKKGTDVDLFDQKVAKLMASKAASATNSQFFAQRFSEKYLYGEYENGKIVGGRITYVRLFSIIAVLILLIACINFMNLSTAQASKKMKEIGVKKTLGADRKALAGQFLGESTILVVLSIGMAALIVALLLPQFNTFTGKQLQTNIDGPLLFSVLGIALLTSLVAGSYPAFYLSGMDSLTVLKGKLPTSFSEFWARKGLVVLQFSLSVLFVVGLLVVHQQIQLTKNKNLGYERDNVIRFPWKGELYDQWSGLGEEGKNNDHFNTFLAGLHNVPGVVSATTMTNNFLDNLPGQSGISWSGEEEEKQFMFQSPIVGYDFIETLGIPMVAGRTFSAARGDDYSKIIINETAQKYMKLEDPIGQEIAMNGGSTIIGVVKDFHYGSLYNGIEPLILRCQPNSSNILVRIQGGAEKATLEKLGDYYSEFLPGYPFEYNFLDEDYQAQYESENRVAVLSKYFAGLAILISCLGLFGLATFTAERRRKEIGIRKVLGAGVFGIVRLLTTDFTRTVAVAVFVALPLAYLGARNWLANYNDHIELAWWYFALPGLLVLLIAWATVGSQTFLAARVNPVACLKEE
ncbi:MAG: ABC transporter permease [Lewinella sp.]|nr:ABC transporter permease [Lewinella sp.]